MKTSHPLRHLLVLPAILLALAPGATRAAAPAAGAWTVTGSMHEARSFQTATLLPNGLVLVAGGDSTNGWIAGAELYHPHTGSWANTGSMHDPRGQNTATLLRDGRVLVVGGCDSYGDCEHITAGAELYDPQTGKWTRTGSLHQPRAFHTATLLSDGRVLVAGGVTIDCGNNGSCMGILAGAELYDPRTGVWTVTGSMHQARSRYSATLLSDGQVLVAGGEYDNSAGGTSPLASAELYNPRTGKWALTGSMHTVAQGQATTLLPNGMVLVDGGSGGIGFIAASEVYHPRTGTWTITGSLHAPRGYDTGQTAALLGNGKVLVVGGFDDAQNALASAELYNPHTGAWTLTGSLHAAHGNLPMTVLASGQVLIAGGSRLANDQSTSLASAEIYTP